MSIESHTDHNCSGVLPTRPFLWAGVMLFALIAPSATLRSAELRFAKIFTEQCVLQREMSVTVWGWTEPGSQVTFEFAGQKKTATANGNGKWLIRLDPMKANAQGQELKVSSCGSSVSLTDILVGDVWLASDQSNMGFSIPKATHAEEAHKTIPHPTLPGFKVGRSIADEPVADIGADGAFQHPRWRMVEMEVIRAEIAWNGSAAGGVADVNDSTSSDRNCIVHDNAGAAFYFSGSSHSVMDSLIFHQSKDFSVQRGVDFSKESTELRGSR